jgi:Domain of unknown function (DUF3850)
MTTHFIKILPQFYLPTAYGRKSFELRKNDRNYQVGDKLVLQEYDGKHYTGHEIHCNITYVLKGGKYGLDPNYCIINHTIIEIKHSNNDNT